MSTHHRSPRQIVLCFHVHQPARLKKGAITEPGQGDWFDEKLDQEIMERVARKCYLPTNKLLLKLIAQYPQIKVVFSLSGLALEQMERYAPDALESFKALAATGNVDFLAETYYNSLAFLIESEEFEIQILEQTERIVDLFGIHPWAFRNTGLIYNDDIGRRISMLGFQGLLTEGSDRALKGTPAGQLFEHRGSNGLKLFFRNPGLSNDIAFHVGKPEHQLNAEKFMSWLEAMPEEERLVTLSLDYETFGEHHEAEVVTDFLEEWLLLLAMQNEIKMTTPAEVLQGIVQAAPISVPGYIAVSDCELSHWLGNDRQREAFGAMVSLEPILKDRNDPVLLRHWRCLQSSDHFYYMSDFADHVSRFSPYGSAQEAFDHYMAAIDNLTQQAQAPVEDGARTAQINNEHEADRRTLTTPTWAMAIDPRGGHPSQ